MTAIYLTVEGNSAPAIDVPLIRKGQAIDLTSVQRVDIIIQRRSDRTIMNDGHSEAEIQSPATAGIVRYVPDEGDFSSAGTYRGDARLTYNDASVEILFEQIFFYARKKIS